MVFFLTETRWGENKEVHVSWIFVFYTEALSVPSTKIGIEEKERKITTEE